MTYLLTNKFNYRTKQKYRNKSCNFGGVRYDSIKEANHAEELTWRIKAKEIKEFIPHFKIDIRVNGQHITNYYVDFKVIMADDSIQFHEVKSPITMTDTWKLKWRLCEILKEEIEPGAEWIVIR